MPPAETVDVREMVVVHTALLREFRLLPRAVADVRRGDGRQAGQVERHLALVCDLMSHHHAGEDELLWPVLGPRLSTSGRELLAVATSQHAVIATALDRVVAARGAWLRDADVGRRTELVEALELLHGLLDEHLEHEERALLPLCASHLSQAEWDAVGRAGANSISKRDLLLVFGMFAYEGDPHVLEQMLRSAPAVPRMVVPRIAPRVYARRARQVYRTPRP